MDTQFVSDLMTQFNNNHVVSSLQGNNTNTNFIDADMVGNETTNIIPTKIPIDVKRISPSIPSNLRPNIGQSPDPRTFNLNQNINRRSSPDIRVTVPNTKMINPEANLNQIPKNLLNVSRTPVRSDTINQNTNQNINQNINQNTADSIQANVNIQSSDFYSIFGFQLSKTTVYIIIAFIAIIVIYYIYKYFTSSSSPDKDKKKRKPEVTFDQQVNSDENNTSNES